MSLYSRPQLWVLLAIAALGGLGIAVGGWRRAHPDLAERIEQFDTGVSVGADTRAVATPAPGGTPHGAGGRNGAARASGAASPREPDRASAPPHPRAPRLTHADRAAGPRPHTVLTPRADAGRRSKRRAAEGPLDLNRATMEDLERLPGVGAGLARRILAARQETGRFTSVDDLDGVTGIGAVRLARLRDLVTVSR